MSAVCPRCGTAPEDGARFCEACGTALGGAAPTPSVTPTAPAEQASGATTPITVGGGATGTVCVRCGGTVASDGYCEQCGEPAANPRDHWAERPSPWVAGVCDRGIRHTRNEDAMALAADTEPGSFAALVVCDGVSSAPDSDVASLAAAKAALAELSSTPRTPDDTLTERMSAWSAALVRSAEAANAAILTTVGDMATRANPPSCTYAAAVVDGPLVVAGWIGDSRAYWLPDEGEAHQLSVDDSWAQEMIERGMARHQAETAPQAHAITRWLGPDAPTLVARTAPTVPDRPGWVMVCSDGLWNYCSPADDLAALVRATQAATGDDPESLAKTLVAWANAQGGQDNVTVTLARVAGRPHEPAVQSDSLPLETQQREPASS